MANLPAPPQGPSIIKNKPIIWNTFLSLCLVAILVYSLFTANRLVGDYVPLSGAIMQIQLESQLGHSWLEEIGQGYRDDQISTVWNHFDKSELYANKMVDGEGYNERMNLLLRDPNLHREIQDMRIKLQEFRAAAEQKWGSGNDSGLGVPSDQNIEALFVGSMTQAAVVETAIEDSLQNDLDHFQTVQVVLVVVVLGFLTFSSIYFHRFERKQAQVIWALRESESRTKSTFNVLSDSVFLHPLLEDGVGTFVEVNQTACDRYEYTKGEFFQLSVNDISKHSDSVVQNNAKNRKALQEEGKIIRQSLHVTKSGIEFPVEINSSITELDGKQMILAVVRDISDRQEANDLLRESQLDYEVLFDDSPIPLWEEDFSELLTYFDGLKIMGIDDFRTFFDANPEAISMCLNKIKILKINKASLALYDAASKEHLFENFEQIFTDQSREVFKEELIAIAEGKTQFETQSEMLTISGELINIYLTLVLDQTPGRRGKALVVTIDTTEKIQLEAQLRQAQKMESVGLLAGGVAHDFNNMLAVILGNTELALAEVNEHQPIYAMLEGIHGAGKRSADLTKQLLAFARKQPIAPQILDLNEAVEGTLRLMRRIIGENIELAWQPGPVSCCIKMDPSQIDQILTNLCVNSRDAINGIGSITIETCLSTLHKDFCKLNPGFYPGNYVLLKVSDNGSGMDKDTLERIFEPFFSTKQGGDRSGLGLATVYGIVKQNQGYIKVTSEPGTGTTNIIYLPIHEGQIPNAMSDSSPPSSGFGVETVLLVEDEASILELATKMLVNFGYTVLGATNPREAILLAREHPSDIHLLLTDVVMPEMTGLDLAAEINAFLPDTKHLFMSGYAANVISGNGVMAEGINFIQKPFAMADLLAKVRSTLDQ